MSGDACNTKIIEAEVQENGIIRDCNGVIIGRLVPEVMWDLLPEVGDESD